MGYYALQATKGSATMSNLAAWAAARADSALTCALGAK